MTSPEITDAAVEAPELLPCPFCGGEPERVDIEDGDNAGGSCICCKQCFASSNVEFGFKENFVSNWNRRALAAGRAEAVATSQLREELRSVMVRQSSTEGRNTYSDGFQQGLAFAIERLDRSALVSSPATPIEPMATWKLVNELCVRLKAASEYVTDADADDSLEIAAAIQAAHEFLDASPAAPAAEAEPAAWQHRHRFHNAETGITTEWTAWEDGRASNELKARASVGYFDFEERPLYAAPPARQDGALREALCNARDFIESSAFNIPTKDYFDAVLREIDAAIALSTAPSAPSERARDFWLQYDHQVGRWCVENKPPKVIRTGAEVIHTREVVASPSSKDVLREALIQSWIDFLDANPDDLTSPEDLPDHALMTCEQFIAYSLAALAQSAPVKAGG